jgi:predicted ArsR family transcriptional regulator
MTTTSSTAKVALRETLTVEEYAVKDHLMELTPTGYVHAQSCVSPHCPGPQKRTVIIWTVTENGQTVQVTDPETIAEYERKFAEQCQA